MSSTDRVIRLLRSGVRRQVAGGLAVVLLMPLAQGALAQQPAPSTQSAPADPTTQASPAQSDPAQPSPAQSNPAQSNPAQTPPPDSAAGSGQSSPADSPAGQNDGTAKASQQNSGAQQPLGTAVAPYSKEVGTPASRPAGAAIAPAKQRRTRSLLIKVGLIVGAAVAVGTVVALSSGSSSRPK